MAHSWSRLGDTVNDALNVMYNRGQRIREAYYRGEKIWEPEEFLRILLTKLPKKLHYISDVLIDYDGAQILGIWSTGRTEDVTKDCVFYPEEGSEIILSDILLGIILTQLPNKTAYSAGERLNYDGVVVLAVYADGHAEDITLECKFYPNPGSLAIAPSLIGIFVTKLPTKTSYAPGESLDFTGVKVIAAYTNGRLSDVTSEFVFSPSSGSTA